MKDLTSIAQTVDDTTDHHLLSAADGIAQHLAVVSQTAAWENKELVATPKASLFAWAWASGVEAYRNVQGGPAVKADTDLLINDVTTALASATLTEGAKAAFAYFCRSEDPYALFSGYNASANYSGHGRSVVAHKFNLRGLPLAKMTSYSAFIRAYIPSLVACAPGQLPVECICFPGTFYNSAATLDVRFSEDQPTVIADGTEPTESFDLGSYCNNGFRPSADTVKGARIYDPFDIEHNGYTHALADDQMLRVFVAGETDDVPNSYHADMELTGDCKTFLAEHMGEFWATFAFRAGNTFSEGANNNNGLQLGYSAMAYIQRFELVLKCTGGTFN